MEQEWFRFFTVLPSESVAHNIISAHQLVFVLQPEKTLNYRDEITDTKFEKIRNLRD